MKTIPLTLSVARDIPMDRGEVFYDNSLKQKIHKRDKNTCMFCGWREKNPTMLNVTSLSSEYLNCDNPKKLVTSCVICNLTQRLGYAFIENAGCLVYLPELTQAQLNELARATFFANATNNKHVYEALEPLMTYIEEEREALVSQYFDIVPFKNSNFSSSLRELDKDLYMRRNQFLGPIRFWPYTNYLKKIVGKEWDFALKAVPLNKWNALANKLEVNRK